MSLLSLFNVPLLNKMTFLYRIETVENGASNTKVMGLILCESKNW